MKKSLFHERPEHEFDRQTSRQELSKLARPKRAYLSRGMITKRGKRKIIGLASERGLSVRVRKVAEKKRKRFKEGRVILGIDPSGKSWNDTLAIGVLGLGPEI